MTDRAKRYQFYNRSRKVRAVSLDPAKAAFLFKIIPCLLHYNKPNLPGYIDEIDCPHGIFRFLPENYLEPRLQKQYLPNFSESADQSKLKQSAPAIHSLMTLGSIGTIAQTSRSDCDYWVSIRLAEIGEAGRDMLAAKCRKIENWAVHRGHKIHFFLMDTDQVRDNLFTDATDSHDAGSALQLLLKDELFRTHILVAGKMLLWWLIPPNLNENQYHQYVEKLVHKKRLNLANYVDLGYFDTIPTKEIFGACLWQRNKALDSPFKSVLKFAYLELLMGQTDEFFPFISDTIKRLVTFPEQLAATEDPLAPPMIDPYLLLAREIVNFFHASKMAEEKLIRKCLFFKTIEGVRAHEDNVHVAILGLMARWNLLPEDHHLLLKDHCRSFTDKLAMGNEVHNFLLASYNRLRQISPGVEGNQAISQRDLSVLGKKLFSYYQDKPHKINYLQSISRFNMEEESLTLHLKGEFFVYAGKWTRDGIINQKPEPIAHDRNLAHLLCWLIINGILQEESRLYLTTSSSPITINDIREMAAVILRNFPLVSFNKIKATEMVKPEKTVKALIIVNWEKNPIYNDEELSADIITANNHGEYFLKPHKGLTATKKSMGKLMTRHFVSRWNKNLEIFIPSQPRRHSLMQLLQG